MVAPHHQGFVKLPLASQHRGNPRLQRRLVRPTGLSGSTRPKPPTPMNFIPPSGFSTGKECLKPRTCLTPRESRLTRLAGDDPDRSAARGASRCLALSFIAWCANWRVGGFRPDQASIKVAGRASRRAAWAGVATEPPR
jgi:hypothetical protein